MCNMASFYLQHLHGQFHSLENAYVAGAKVSVVFRGRDGLHREMHREEVEEEAVRAFAALLVRQQQGGARSAVRRESLERSMGVVGWARGNQRRPCQRSLRYLHQRRDELLEPHHVGTHDHVPILPRTVAAVVAAAATVAAVAAPAALGAAVGGRVGPI